MGMIVSEATVDRLIEERTEARAEALRAQERVRGAEQLGVGGALVEYATEPKYTASVLIRIIASQMTKAMEPRPKPPEER